MIDLSADRPVHRQLADLLRDQITSGALPVGTTLPAESRLAAEHGLGRDSARAALAILRAEGLVVTRAPYGTTVRSDGRRRVEKLPRGSTVVVRMPTPAEALELGVDQTTPVAEIRFGGNEPRVVDATSVELSTS